MPDVSLIQEPIKPEIDSLAKEELASSISREKRKSQMEGLEHEMNLLVLKIVVGVLSLVAICRIFHLILPRSYQWLSEEQITKLDEFFIHGTIGALLFEYLKGKVYNNHK